MSVAINGTNGITFNDGSLQPSAPEGQNLIINGNMNIAQRATSVTGITATNTYRTVDRWKSDVVTSGTWTQTQDSDVPLGQGFAESLKMDCTTADTSVGATDRILLGQRFEGFNVQGLAKGTSAAKSVTLSFWVKSNKTGTYIVELFDSPNSRQVSKAYTIDSANTWEYKTITYPADTTGVFANDNSLTLLVQFWLAAGSDYSSGTLNTSWAANTNANRAVGQVNLADSTSNYLNITGVQLEVGTTATPFENLQYETQLALCQRYFQKSWEQGDAVGSSVSTTDNTTQQSWGGLNATSIAGQTFLLPVTMRTSPTLVLYDLALTTGKVTIIGAGAAATNNITPNLSTANENRFFVRMYGNNTAGIIFAHTLEAEL